MSLIDFHLNDKIDSLSDNLPVYLPVNIDDALTFAIGNERDTLAKHLGIIQQNSVINFWTSGRYTMANIIAYVLRQTGPADIVACTWAVSKPAVDILLRLNDIGLLRSFSLWIDPRVKVRNPVPLDMLRLRFPDGITIAPVHAKVTCISNDDWHISLSGSLNFTTSPQPERGTLCTIPHVWQTDHDIILRQFLSPS